MFIPTFARCLSILAESQFLHKGFASPSPCPEATRWIMPSSNQEVAIPWGWRRADVVLSVDGWTRGSVFECGRCHQWVQQSGGSCVLLWFSYWLVPAHREDAEARFLVCVFQAGMRLSVWYVWGGGGVAEFRTTSIGHLLSLVLGIRRWLYRQRSGLSRSLKNAMICSRLGTHTQQRRNTETGLWCG